MPIYLAWHTMCALALVLVTCCGRRTQPQVARPFEMFKQAAEAKGTDYFLLKRRIMAVENARKVTHKLLKERRLGWQERLVARAVLDELKRPGHTEEMRRRFGLLLVRAADLKETSVPARDERGPPQGKTKALASDPELPQTLDSLASEVGLLAEVALRHTPGTIAELVAKAHAYEQKRLHGEWTERRKERSENPNAAIGPEPKLFTAEALLKNWSAGDRRRCLGVAKSLAARAIALAGTEQSEQLIEEMVREEGDLPKRTSPKPGRTSAPAKKDVRKRQSIRQSVRELKAAAERGPETPAGAMAMALLARRYAEDGSLDQAVLAAERLRTLHAFSLEVQSAIQQVWRAYRDRQSLAALERRSREVLGRAASGEDRIAALTTLYRLGVAHKSGGFTADAERVLGAAEKGLRVLEVPNTLLVRRGFALMDFSKLREAEECFRRALDSKAQSPEAYFGLVEACSRLGTPEDAVKRLPLEELTPQDMLTAAVIFDGWGAPEAGLEILLEAERRIPKGDVALRRRGKDVRRRLVLSAIARAREEQTRAERLTSVMLERAEASGRSGGKEAHAARARAYEEQAQAARSRIQDLLEGLKGLLK